MIRTDILSRMLERKQISFAEYLAGRLWQEYLEDVQIQGYRCWDWSAPLHLQAAAIYQKNGDVSDHQAYASDVRRILKGEIGAIAFGDLDRILSLPEYVKLRLTDEGVRYVAGILRLVSIALDIQGNGGDPFADSEVENEPDVDVAADRIVRMRREQPWLFAPHRRQSRKYSANEILGRETAR
jgi:hypothetical protein